MNNQDLNGESIWSRTTEIPPRRPLPGDVTADAAVIGAGMAGILTAFLLSRRGISVIVLEADRIAGGQTKNTTAKITSQHGLFYQKLIRTAGKDRAACTPPPMNPRWKNLKRSSARNRSTAILSGCRPISTPGIRPGRRTWNGRPALHPLWASGPASPGRPGSHLRPWARFGLKTRPSSIPWNFTRGFCRS